jgi:transcriptional regulator with XRE-family HTH domain
MKAVVHVGDRLKELRIRRAMTQNELAEAAGIGKNTVNRIERNHTEPRPPTLRKLADALRVDPAELIGGG